MNSSRHHILSGIALILLVLSAWFFWPQYILQRAPIAQITEQQKLTAAGQFGDAYGSYTSLLTALTFLGVAYGLYIQNTQLRLAQQEADEERRARHAEAAERRFFQMLDIAHAQVAQLSESPFHGIQALRVLASNAVNHADTFHSTAGWDLEMKLANIRTHLARNMDKPENERTVTLFYDCLELYVQELISQPKELSQPMAKLLIASVSPVVVFAGAIRIACNGNAHQRGLWRAFLDLASFAPKSNGALYREVILPRLSADILGP